MKLTIVLVAFTCLQVQAKGVAAQEKITLQEKNAPLDRIFKAIRQQTDYQFFYTVELLKESKKVDVNVNNVSLKEALDECFKNQPLTYEIVEKIIIIKPRKQEGAGDPPITVRGRVTNEQGEPVAGATVAVKGTNKATSTNNNGEFLLKDVDGNGTVTISSVNNETVEEKVNGREVLVVALKNKIDNMLEVVVNKGYYTSKKITDVGNVSTITSKDIEKQPVGNVLLAMQGRLPGVVITQNTGVVGGAVNVQIRGQNSIAQSRVPLYVVDGVPYGALPSLSIQGLSSNILGDAGRINPFNYLNPADILSIDVLKDADATAIYGSRGSNGVILITTKKGKSGKMSIDVNMQSGFGKVTRKADLMNTEQYLEMRNEAFKNSGTAPSATDYDVNGKWSKTGYTDWQDFFIGGSARYNDLQASVSGGSGNTYYRIGSGYHKETTVFPMPKEFNDEKNSVHFNINSSSSDKRFNIVFSGSYLSDKNKLPATDFSQYILLAPNAQSLYNTDGTLNWTDFSENPLREKFRNYTLRSKNLIGNVVLNYKVISGLEMKTSIGYTNTVFNENTATFSSYFPPAFSFNGAASFNNYSTNTLIIEPQLNYQIKYGKSSINALAGATIQQRKSEGQSIDGSGYANDALLGSLAAASTISKGSTIYEQYKYNSLFSRISYDWDQTYLLNITIRRDGSSRFGPGKQFGNFGAVGGGWLFSNEPFIQRLAPFISFGKVRASYGTTGNEPGQNYQYLELFNFTGNTPYQGGSGIIPNNLPAPGYSWEVNKKLEIGAELGLWKDRILVSASYYVNRCGNQLVANSLPSTTGFISVTANLPALVQNAGWEFTLNTVNLKTNRLTWTTSFNISTAKNKLLDFPGLQNNVNYRNLLVVGEPITMVKRFQYAKLDSQTGTYLFYDSKGNLTSAPVAADRIVYINTAPTCYGGLQNTMEYKNFQVDIFFQFLKTLGSNYLFSSNYAPGQFISYSGGNQPVDVLNRWQKVDDNAVYQKFIPGSNNAYNNYAKASNISYSDASFIRLKNVSLSYRIPLNWQRKMNLENLRIYAQVQNLLTITGYKGADPENQTMTSLPPLRVFTFGVQLSF